MAHTIFPRPGDATRVVVIGSLGYDLAEGRDPASLPVTDAHVADSVAYTLGDRDWETQCEP